MAPMCCIYHRSSAAGTSTYLKELEGYRKRNSSHLVHWSVGNIGTHCVLRPTSVPVISRRGFTGWGGHLEIGASVRSGRWEPLLRKSDYPITIQRVTHESMDQTPFSEKQAFTWDMYQDAENLINQRAWRN